MRKFCTVVLLLGFFVITSGFITVSGTGTVCVPADFATINLSVETKGRNVEVVHRENDQIIQILIAALKEQNIDESDIATSWFNIYPNYENNYTVSNQLSVKVRDTKNVGKIISIATAAGANNINGVQFGVEDNPAAYNLALTKAIEDAKRKAKVIANTDLKIASIKEGHNFCSYRSFEGTPILGKDLEIVASVEITFDLA